MRSRADAGVAVMPYAPGHHDAVCALVLDIQQNEFGLPASFEEQPDLRDPAGFFRHGCGEFWVASVDGEVVGCVGLLDFGGRRAALRKMFVRADRRGAEPGVAHALLDALLAHARARGLAEIWLDTHKSFKAAHRFYEKNGFRHVAPTDVPKDFPAMSDDRFYRLSLDRGAQSEVGFDLC